MPRPCHRRTRPHHKSHHRKDPDERPQRHARHLHPAAHLDVSPARVFTAWTDRDAKARWFAAGSPDYELDFRVGGREHARANVDGKQIGWETLYREIVADQRIVYTSVLSEDDTVATLSLTTVEFVATAWGGTQRVLVEQGAYLDGRELPEWREQGTAGQLDALDGETAPRRQRQAFVTGDAECFWEAATAAPAPRPGESVRAARATPVVPPTVAG